MFSSEAIILITLTHSLGIIKNYFEHIWAFWGRGHCYLMYQCLLTSQNSVLEFHRVSNKIDQLMGKVRMFK